MIPPGSADRRVRAVPIDGRGPDGQYHRQHPRRQLQAGGAPSGDEGRRRRRHEDLSGAAAHCNGRSTMMHPTLLEKTFIDYHVSNIGFVLNTSSFYVQDEEAAVLNTHGWLGMVLYKMPYLSIQMGLNEIHCSLFRDGATAG